MKRRLQPAGFGAFERPAEVWQVMGAPAFMWDDGEALRVARLVMRPGWRLDTPGIAGSQADRFAVKRFRRDVAGAVLRQCGELTEVERSRLERWPPFRAPRVAPHGWLPGVSVAEVAAGRLPREA